MTTRRRILESVCASALLLFTAACDKEEEGPKCGEPFYGGSATDESWMTMVDAQKKSADSSKAVTVTWPAEGEVQSQNNPPPKITWTSPLRASLMRDTPGKLAQAPSPRRSRSVLSWLGELLVPTAEAHLPPYTGDIYWVQITVPGRECPVEMLTTDLSWQLDDATWAPLAEPTTQGLSIQITSAYLQENRLKEGPFKMAQPRIFQRVSTSP
jgi:hypothetical protein